MKFAYAGFFCFLLLPDFAIAQDSSRVDSIVLLGNQYRETVEILQAFQTRPGSVFRPSVFQQDLDRLVRDYLGEGFLKARVESTAVRPSASGGSLDVTIGIHEGKRAVVHLIHFEGNRAFTESQLLEEMDLQTHEKFSPSTLEAYIERLLHMYEQKGYAFSRIVVGDIVFSDVGDSLQTTITLLIDERKQVFLRGLRVEGNKSTKEYVIARESRLRENEVFTQDLAERIKRRLERLKLFSSVSMPELFLNEHDEGGLLLRVAEGNPNFFDGVVGYVPSQRPQEEGYFTGLVDVQFRNLLGTGRRLSTRWYRENQQSQEIEVRYFEPWISSYPVNVALGFFQRKQDSMYVRRSYDVNAELMVNEDLNIGASFVQTNVFPAEGYGKTVVAETRTLSFGGFVRYDSRDDAVTPTSGALYRTEYQSGTKELLDGGGQASPKRSSTQRISLDLSYYFSPVKGQVVSAESHLRDFRTEKVEVSDLFRLGGASTLRGYREGQFLGSTLVWTNLEYRFLAGSRSYFYGFTDIGNIVILDNPTGGLQKSELTKVGYGLGLRVDSGLGLIGVNIGFGEGDTFSTAKLHIRLINEF